jgi:xanthine dehydrogenase accessory factor
MEQDYRPIGVYRHVIRLIDAGSSFAAALVLQAEGSTPQRAGARAAIEAAGRIWGTLGGGAVEAEAQRRAAEVCRLQRPAVFDFRLDHADAGDAGAICGGVMRILLDPAAGKHRTCFDRAVAALTRRQRGVLLTTFCGVMEVTVDVCWLSEDAVAAHSAFPGGAAVRRCLAEEMPRLFVDESATPAGREIFVEPVVAPPRLLIAGGGHVGQALARQALQIGFDVTVIDDRPEFTTADLFPEGAATICGNVAQGLTDAAIDRDTFVVIVTRGHRHDAAALAACIRAPAAYIGMIGSRRKVAMLRQQFLENALATAEEFDRVVAPVGVPIGAVTVPEIATSIAAQLIAVRRERSPR